MWENLTKSSRLGVVLLFKVLTAGFLCIAIYVVLINITVYYINNLRVDLESYNEQINFTANDFQNYINESHVSIKDIDAIKAWDKKQNLMHIRLVENNRVIYDSLEYITRFTPKVSYIYYDLAKDISSDIEFIDGKATLYITILYKQRIEQRMDYAIGAFCILLFYLAIFHEFRNLVKEIIEIKKGIQILEGGDLTFELPTKRKDEIADLADSINRMSKELDHKRREEENLRVKNYDLVTSISHDIRTPLTIINSYIDIIKEKRYSDIKELDRYLEKVKEKSLLINDLTDNLFTHFLNQNTEFKYYYEVVIGNDFIKHILNSLVDGLTDRGYHVITNLDMPEDFFLKVDVMQIQRVFNNLEGNLIKYALKSKPINYTVELTNNIMKITGKNHILSNNHFDSRGVGMNNCQEILNLHGGEIKTYIEEDCFLVIMCLPIYIIE